MRLLWLADVLRANGLTVHEYPHWHTRGLASFGPVRGIICHGTAGRLSIESDLSIIAITGSATANPPIAQLVLARNGDWWVVASGTCTGVKTGTAGPLKGFSDDAVLQIEAQHAKDEAWTEVQYRSYVRGVAALVSHSVPGYAVTIDRVAGHYEHQPTEKTDPWFDMAKFRDDLRAGLIGDETMLLIKVKGHPAVYVSDGTCRRHLTSFAALQAAQSAGHRLVEVASPADLDALAGPEKAPAIPVNLTEADRQAIIDGLALHLAPTLLALRQGVRDDTRDAVADMAERGAAGVRADT